MSEGKIKTLGDAFRLTREELDRHGWCQKIDQNETGQHCLVGALTVAFGAPAGEERDSMLALELSDEDYERLIRTVGFLEEFLGSWDDGVEGWNDQAGRTYDEVVSVLDRAIAQFGDEEL